MQSRRPVVLITGGSRGIGAAVAQLAAARGYDVAITYRSEREASERVLSSCRAASARAVACRGDVAVEADVLRLFDEAEAALGAVSHVVNNAGITGRSSRLEQASAETIRACIDINVLGALWVAREAARRLSVSRGGAGGTIVNISSVAASLGSPNEYVWYAASKGAVDSLTVGLAKELAGEGIRVNAVSPGMTRTDIHERSTGDAGRLERLRPHIPLNRIGEPDEIAEAVLFLMSEAASYITGANIPVSGGR
ncbi:glucose 1-dehydrogenase [Microvirga aerilata]|uniref:Glucose 1-dehydrogenase n=1 Tax=Microvirga aerilata TaxID=670292 RepID=A0A936ZET1_9HYPH|nr:glucose 1-dehydrogenase [Microvirga aerilata]MBL0405837.1 glucose 1-dehydrogenase [Microvirga aerilata]